jgi:voltage-gated potassium channel Kch
LQLADPGPIVLNDIVEKIAKLQGFRFVQLSIFFVFFMILMPLLDKSWLLKSITQLYLLNMLLVAFSTMTRFARASLWIAWIISVAGSLVEELPVAPTIGLAAKYMASGALGILVIMCSSRILAVVLRSGQVTLDSIFASVVVYQLIGIFVASVYTLTMLADPDGLQLPGSGPPPAFGIVQIDMIYFSFVTLATLGYGDIVPVSSFARSIAVTEALVGQFYVAVVVALLIGAYVSQKLESHEQ